MKALRLHKIHDLTVDEVCDPILSGNEVLVKIGACGICGTDIPRVFELGTRVYPITLGHEFSGTVVRTANSVDEDLIGKRAALFNIVPCHVCGHCIVGEYAHCDKISYLGTRIDGGFAEYCVVPSRFNIIVCPSEKISFDVLAMLEPISVALHTIRVASLRPWDSLVILGAGPIGILIARWAQLFGLKKIILVDILKEKVAFAKACGVEAFAVSEAKKAVTKLTAGRGTDVVIEGTGSSDGISFAIEIVGHTGNVLLLGNPRKEIIIPVESYSTLLRKELTLKSIWNSYYGREPVNEWEFSMEKIVDGELVVNDIITHKVDLEGLPALFQDIYYGNIVPCKAVFSAEK